MENPTKRKVLVIEVGSVTKELEKFLAQNFEGDEVVVIENAAEKLDITMGAFFKGGYTDIVFQSVFTGTSGLMLKKLLREMRYQEMSQLRIHSLSGHYLIDKLNELWEGREAGAVLLEAIRAVTNHRVREYDFFGDWQRRELMFDRESAKFTNKNDETKDPRKPWPKI